MQQQSRGSALEFRAFCGLVMATAAISIDMLLPAFSELREEFGLPSDSPQTAAMVTSFFLGMAVGQIPVGMISDRYGRLPVLFAGNLLFFAAAVGAMIPTTLGPIIVLRFVWGLGASAMRVCVVAMIRDRFEGVAMAREMAFAMTIFTIVPIAAPLLGTVIVSVLPWRSIFAVCAGFGVLLGIWAALRIDETLRAERRRSLSFGLIGEAARAITSNRMSLAYTAALLPTMGVFASYLASSERIVEDVFDKKSWFPYIFGATALAMGAASLNAGRIVGRLGLQKLLRIVLVLYTGFALVAAVVSVAADGRPNFWIFMALFTVVLAAHNVLFPNLNAAAMQPVGEVAGTAAAVIATVSTAVGSLIGLVIDRVYDQSTNPLIISFLLSGVIAVGLVEWANRTRPVATT